MRPPKDRLQNIMEKHLSKKLIFTNVQIGG